MQYKTWISEDFVIYHSALAKGKLEKSILYTFLQSFGDPSHGWRHRWHLTEQPKPSEITRRGGGGRGAMGRRRRRPAVGWRWLALSAGVFWNVSECF